MIDVPPDDDLLVVLKQSYYDALRYVGGSGDSASIASGIVSDARDVWLDRRENYGKDVESMTPQYRAYEYMYAENALLVANGDAGRVLEMYALLVFYETFGMTQYGNAGGIDFECTWPGVTCRTIDASADDASSSTSGGVGGAITAWSVSTSAAGTTATPRVRGGGRRRRSSMDPSRSS